MSAKGEWERRHPPENGVPSRLFTDENPATTIKGTGFRDRKTAERTIRLTSQRGVRYKQYWTIRAMRERAVFHPHQTVGMRDAVVVFDEWLKREEQKPPLSPRERTERELEWKEYRKLCESAANNHSYGSSPTKNDLKRARDDLKCGKDCLLTALGLARERRKEVSAETKFPLAAFTALFGGPGLHGYGRHKILDGNNSHVTIDGTDGLLELLSRKRARNDSILPLGAAVTLYYNRRREMARAELEYVKSSATITNLWNNSRAKEAASENNPQRSNAIDGRDSSNKGETPSWTCKACTLEHVGRVKQHYLVCEVCGTSRVEHEKERGLRKPAAKVSCKPHLLTNQSKSAAWGSLRPPTDRDIRGPRKRHKALDAPPPLFDFLIVLDLEWTADDNKRMEPIAEITQLPSVAMRLTDKKWGRTPNNKANTWSECWATCSQIELPLDLTTPPCIRGAAVQADACAVSAFDTFVKPTLNPTLTKFSIGLTAITQESVDAAPCIDIALKNYVKWLESLDLVDPSNGRRKGNWCFCTWGDVDIMGTLRKELEYKSIALPPCFDRWINLKNDSIFKKHYGREPRGGLRACVESVGAHWEGRAHNGLVDSINTAKIVRHMVQTGFRFTRPTRGIDKDGTPFGQKKKPK